MQDNQKVPTIVTNHVRSMRVAVDVSRVKCVDGGYKENEATGAMSFAGGALGLSMMLLAHKFSPREAFTVVRNFLKNEGIRYGWHTDQHEGHQGVLVGCGHCNAAINQSEKYGLDSNAVEQLLNMIRQELENSTEIECVVLDREHTEEGILVVTSTNYTVKPWDESLNRQFFIYDQTHHVQLLQKLASYLEKINITVSFDDLLVSAQNQTNTTLGLLASSKGKPMYSVDSSQEEPVIKVIGHAPSAD